jgi:hypothetical protein
MKKKPDLYHVTAVSNVKSILKHGLKGFVTPRLPRRVLPGPTVFALTSSDERLTDSIAINQVWPFDDIEQYAVIRIAAKGIAGRVMADDVAEFTAPWQRMIVQEVISPKHLKLLRIRTLNFPGKALFTAVHEGWKRRWTAKEKRIVGKWYGNDYLRQFEAIQLGLSA